MSLRWFFLSYFGHVSKLYMMKRMALHRRGSVLRKLVRTLPEILSWNNFPIGSHKRVSSSQAPVSARIRTTFHTERATLPGHFRLGLAARAAKIESTAREAPTNSLGKGATHFAPAPLGKDLRRPKS